MEKPLLIYDGDCGFCKYWVDRWKKTTGEKIQYESYQEIISEIEEVTREQAKRSVWLILDDKVLSAAEAVVTAYGITGNTKWLWIYNNIPLADKIFELTYKLIANHRSFFFKLTKIFFKHED